MKLENSSILIKVQEMLSSKRYVHSIRVAEEAGLLAEKWGCSAYKAQIAGLLHDIARDWEPGKLLRRARQEKLIFCEVEHWVPELLHAPVGALIAKEEFEIHDPVILSAITHHTLGAPQMTVLDKVVFLADLIEPGRSYPGIQFLRELAWKDLNKAVLHGITSTLEYVLKKGGFVHPRSVETRNYLLRLEMRRPLVEKSCFFQEGRN